METFLLVFLLLSPQDSCKQEISIFFPPIGKHLTRRETQQGDTKGEILIKPNFRGVLRISGVLYQCGWH